MLRLICRRQPGHTQWIKQDSPRYTNDYHCHCQFHYNNHWQHQRYLSQQHQQHQQKEQKKNADFDIETFKANSRRVIFESGRFSLQPQVNLVKALTGVIPHPSPPSSTPTTALTSSSSSSSSSSSNDELTIPPGFHFVYCNEMVTPSHLLPDGTDDLHCPSPSSPSSSDKFMFRLWAGGDISFALAQQRRTTTATATTPNIGRSGGSSLCLGEQVADVRMVDGGNKVFVKVRRTLVEYPSFVLEGDDNSNSSQLEHIREIALDLHAAKKLNSTYLDDPDPDPVRLHLVENRWLCFTQTPPTSAPALAESDNDKTDSHLPLCPSTDDDKNSTKVKLDYLIHPDTALLFRFSALTLNAHAIHLDREYTRRVYGLPDLVVQGPLTVCLMMQALSSASASASLIIDTFSYTNLAPLYVDQTMKICVSGPPAQPQAEGEADVRQVWNVWISKKVNGVWRVAVRATAKMAAKMAARPAGE